MARPGVRRWVASRQPGLGRGARCRCRTRSTSAVWPSTFTPRHFCSKWEPHQRISWLTSLRMQLGNELGEAADGYIRKSWTARAGLRHQASGRRRQSPRTGFPAAWATTEVEKWVRASSVGKIGWLAAPLQHNGTDLIGMARAFLIDKETASRGRNLRANTGTGRLFISGVDQKKFPGDARLTKLEGLFWARYPAAGRVSVSRW